jgi:N-acyl-D-amino-acid deacylase
MTDYDLILRDGILYDGSGAPPIHGDLAIRGDRISAIGAVSGNAHRVLNVDGLVVAPGFINMLSWAVESLIVDGRSQSDIRQGVTLEVMGEGTSMGPLSEQMKTRRTRGILGNKDIAYDIEWTTLGEYLQYLEQRGVSCNVTSFVGTGTLRRYAMGDDDRPPTPAELDLMKQLVHQAMQEGAVGMSAALIYPPASYAQTAELIALAEVVAEYDGLYISHIRSEGAAFFEALDELMDISRQAGVRAEIYHLKAAGRPNWHKMDEAIRRLESARAAGLPISADMYPYPVSGTGLDACLPPWTHDGGEQALLARLRDPDMRARIKAAMNTPSTDWENMWLDTGSPERIILAGLNAPHLKPLIGSTLAQAAALRGTAPEDTAFDLLLENEGGIFCMYASMSEDNLRKQIILPWVTFCSDGESLAPEGVFLKSNPHPRAYGSFARILGRYVRDEGVISLESAIYRLTALPAANLHIAERGRLLPGCFADIAVFDPASIQDHATYAQPHQYSTGMHHVFVNGVQVLADGDHTGAKPGRFVKRS